MASYTFLGFFTKSKVGVAPANAPTVDVVNVGTNTLVISGGSPTAITALPGLYSYTYSGSTGLRLVAAFKTTDNTVDLQHVPSYTPTEITDNLDAAVSTRLAAGNYTAPIIPPTANEIADQVWEEIVTDHDTPLTTGALLTGVATTTDPLLNIVPGVYGTGTAGGALGLLVAGVITNVTQVYNPQTKTMSFYYGDDYAAEDNRAQDFTTALTLTNGSVAWRVKTNTGVISIPCTLVDEHTYRLAPSASQLIALGVGMWYYELEIVLASGHTITEIKGSVTIMQDVH